MGATQCGQDCCASDEFRTCNCCSQDFNTCDKVCGDVQSIDERFVVECTVQKVLVQRRQQPVPSFGWLAGQRETLMVELAVDGAQHEAQMTSSGSKIEAAQSDKGDREKEAWVWGEPITMSSGVSKHKGELLEFEVHASAQMRLRVLAGKTGWYRGPESPELLGEVRFRVKDDVVPSEAHDGALSLPLVQDSRVQGTAWLTVRLRRESPSNTDDILVRSVPSAQRRLVRLKGHRGPVTCCAVFPDERRVLTVSTDKCGIIWSQSGQRLTTLEGHAAPLTSCDVFPSGEQVLTLSEDATSTIWSTSGMQLATLSGTRICVLFPSGDKILAATGADTGAIFSTTGEKVATLQGHTKPITACAVFPDEQQVLTCSEDEESIIWTTFGDTVRVLRAHTDAVTCCALGGDGARLITGSRDTTAILWLSSSTKPLHLLRGHKGAVVCCAFFAADHRVVTGGEDHKTMLWSDDGDLVATLTGHSASVTCCSIFAPQNWVLTASADKTGIIWSRRGQMLGMLHGHADRINACKVFQSGDQVLTASSDHTALIWPVALFVDTALDVKEVEYAK